MVLAFGAHARLDVHGCVVEAWAHDEWQPGDAAECSECGHSGEARQWEVQSCGGSA